MGKAQKKTGKGRLDKYYKLAKEQGYRARSAFKLIQLNKKYNFLEGARACIDLCAAPGGWLQVASKYMPQGSLIVGVDLVPIKPIPRVATFAADITTAHCRTLLRAELKNWKADVVLHDGAPNVGSAWVQDAYSQSELVLMSLKLAVEFLAKGGTFITKVFRSVDYNNLIWVFSQLFGKVEATKPPSSRNVSAEIFVVCRDFLAPKVVDPKFLDPKHVFQDVSASLAAASTPSAPSTKAAAALAQTNVFQPEKKRRKRDGYADGDYTLHSAAPVADFVRAADPIALLGSVSQLTFASEEEKEWAARPITTADVRANLDDLKVLGRRDFKTLLRWRVLLREELGLEGKADDKDDEEVEEEGDGEGEPEAVDEDAQIEEELARLGAEAAARTKRERRRANELRTRTIQRLQLQMSAPMDLGLEQTDGALGNEDIFDLGETEKRGARRFVSGDAGAESDLEEEAEEAQAQEEEDEEVLDSDEERERRTAALEGDLDGLYDSYRQRLAERSAKFRAQEARKKDKLRAEWTGFSAAKGSDEEDADELSGGEGGWESMQAAKGRDDPDTSADEDSSDEEAEEEEEPAASRKRARAAGEEGGAKKRARLVKDLREPGPSGSRAADVWFSQDVFGAVGDLDELEDDEDEESAQEDSDEEMGESHEDGPDTPETPSDGEDDDFEIVPAEPEDTTMWDVEDEDEDAAKAAIIKERGLLTAEAVTLAQQLVNRQKTKTDMLNEGFTRYALNAKDGLPEWFLDDESKHYKPNLPVTKEAVAALRAKQRALDARPIKKVAEAKARKKLRAVQRLEKAMKKAEGVTQSEEMSEREKARQVERVLARGSKAAKRKEIKVVVARGANKGVKGRPKGVKGRYAMVDARMRKELRVKKRKEKENKKRKH